MIPSATPTRQCGSHIANIQLMDPGVKMKDLMGSDPLLLLDNGSQPCLSFLLRQGCWSRCHRAATHGHTLTVGIHAHLVMYLNTQMQKLRAASAHQAESATTVLP
jgi:hypothetical protein